MNNFERKKILKKILLGVRNGGFITPAINQIEDLLEEQKKEQDKEFLKRLEILDVQKLLNKLSTKSLKIVNNHLNKINQKIKKLKKKNGKKRN